MVAIDKIDENPGFDLNRLFLMEKYPNIKGFYRLSCAFGTGIDEFKKDLTKELADIELIRTTWANSWFQVKKQLEEMKDNFISYDTYQQICAKAGIIDEKEQDTLVDFLPKSVMPRFIVRSHKDIKDKLSWRTGVVLENKGFNATAVVKADQREKIINIFVTGTQKRDYFAAILHTFREMNNSFEQIEVDECVPLPDKTKIAVNYLHLLRLERMGQAEFLPEKAERNYNVKELLEGIKPEKERQKELEHLLRENKMVINVLPAAPVTPKEPGTKKLLKTILKIAAAVAALIAFLAALFALIDSQSFREFWEKLIG